jgi:hypothetical protein
VPARSIAPKILEPRRRQLGVPDGVLNVLVAEIGLQGPGIVPGVRKGEARRVAQHVRMDTEPKPGLDAQPRDHLSAVVNGEPRSLVNTNGLTRGSARSARISSP